MNKERNSHHINYYIRSYEDMRFLIEENIKKYDKIKLDIFPINLNYGNQLNLKLDSIKESDGLKILRAKNNEKTSKKGFSMDISHLSYEIIFLGNIALTIAINIISNILHDYIKNDKGGKVFVNDTTMIINVNKLEINYHESNNKKE